VPTAAEKEAKQAARDVAVSSVTQGQRRLAAEQPKAAGAFPVRRLRSSGDLSRYAIGGFADDPLAPVAAAPKPKAAPKAKAKVKAAKAVKAAPAPQKKVVIPHSAKIALQDALDRENLATYKPPKPAPAPTAAGGPSARRK